MALNVVLYQPEIPPNTGNIARTCALVGARLHLVKPLGFSIDDKSVKRAGLDYWHLVNLTVHESFEDFLSFASDTGGAMYFASTKGGSVYSDVSFPENVFIVFGRETSGLPAWVYEDHQDRLIRIPMLDVPSARSLNLSNSASILIYEVLRQHGFPGLR